MHTIENGMLCLLLHVLNYRMTNFIWSLTLMC